MVDLTKRIHPVEARRVAKKFFPIGTVLKIDTSQTLCTGIVIGHIFYKNGGETELLSVLCKLLVLIGKDKYVAMISANQDGEVEIWSSDLDEFTEIDWVSDDWSLET